MRRRWLRLSRGSSAPFLRRRGNGVTIRGSRRPFTPANYHKRRGQDYRRSRPLGLACFPWRASVGAIVPGACRLLALRRALRRPVLLVLRRALRRPVLLVLRRALRRPSGDDRTARDPRGGFSSHHLSPPAARRS